MILCSMGGNISIVAPSEQVPQVSLYTYDDSELRSDEFEALFGDGRIEPKMLTVGRDVWNKIFAHCDALMIVRTISTCKGLWLRFKDSPQIEKWKLYLSKDAVCVRDSTLFVKVPEVLPDFVCTVNALPGQIEKNINATTGEKQVKMITRRTLMINTFMTGAEHILRKAVQAEGLIEAAKCGEESIVCIYLSRGVFTPWAIYSAARFDHQSIALALLRWLAHENPQQPPEILNLPVFGSMVRDWIAGKDINTIKSDLGFTGEYQLPVYGFAEFAAENGDIEALEFLLYFQKTKLDNHRKIYASAAKGGHINVIEWLRKNVNNPYIYDIVPPAATTGQIHVIVWAMNNLYQHLLGRDKIIRAAAINGCSLSLIFIMEFYSGWCQVSEESADQAAVHGHLEFLQCAQWYGELDVGRCKKLAQRHYKFNIVEGLKW